MATVSRIRIATRRSPLAMRQAELVKSVLLSHFPDLSLELIPIVTSGDKLLNQSLTNSGGKGLFIKELEQAILDNEADIAVHSLKDMPAECAPGLELNTFLERDDPRDVLIAPGYQHLNDLPRGAKIGTASPRRHAIVKHILPDLQIELLRGNVNTRLAKLANKDYDAIILAAAGLHRLALDQHISYYFSPAEFLPAIGQGVIAIESRINDKAIKKLLIQIDHYPTRLCVTAERAMNHALGGNCHAPIAGYATIQGETLQLRGKVLAPDGSQVIDAELIGNKQNAQIIGLEVANILKNKGAEALLSIA